MTDCKYILPCGRCDKLGAPCDANKVCNHNWISCGETTITTKSTTIPIGCYEYLLCEKCGKHMLRPWSSPWKF